jgi:two-component system nitrate/nitrite response regulator NarL
VHALVVTTQSSIHDPLGAVLREAFPGIVVHRQTSLEGALTHVRRTARMDLVLVDLALPGCSRLEALTYLRNKLPPCRIVVLSLLDARAQILSALRAGAAGYLPRGCARNIMIAALRLAALGQAAHARVIRCLRHFQPRAASRHFTNQFNPVIAPSAQ